ncbi:hypothetical protein OCT59_017332 [Rhizophagus irregularis]|nr:hypothetical protein OCT59_017332 [Rhizophagus irregularis]
MRMPVRCGNSIVFLEL